MDAASIMGALNGLKFAKDALTTLAQGKIEIESQTKILAALEKLGSTQNAIFEMREQLLALQEQNRTLKQELEQADAWNEKIGSYKLTQTPGGAVVHASIGEPPHFVCPSCVNERKLQILQDRRTMAGLFRCPGCKVEYPIKPERKPPPIRYPNNGII